MSTIEIIEIKKALVNTLDKFKGVDCENSVLILLNTAVTITKHHRSMSTSEAAAAVTLIAADYAGMIAAIEVANDRKESQHVATN